MEAFIIYMAKASGLLALFLTSYYILLRKETFFNSNRGFLLAGLITSALLPLVEYTKVVWVEPSPKVAVAQTATPTDMMALQQYILQQQLAATSDVEVFSINWGYVAFCIYIIGVLFFLMRFIVDFKSIRHIVKGNSIKDEGNYKLIDSKKVKSPFSFFNYIVYNSVVLQPEELESIIAHEKVHSRQRHSADMIVSQLFCIAFWFNPFVWLYKKSISQNLEFIADAVAIKQLSDRKTYQRTLLKITLQPECIAITNHFYQSLIKKRIVMLNKKQSKRRNSWKYAIVLPALAAFMLAFQVKAVAQEKATTVNSVTGEKFKVAITVDKDSKDDELASETKVFKDQFDADVTFSNVTRNETAEITGVRVLVKDKTQSKVYEITGNKPIPPFTIEIEKGSDAQENSIAFGRPDKKDNAVASSVSYSESTTNKEPLTTSYSYSKSEDNTTKVANVDKDALVVINGVKQPKGDADKVQFPSGQTVVITKLSPKEGKKKYGKEGMKGVVEITTTKKPNNFYTYTYNQNGDELPPMPPMPPMPSTDEIMEYASTGIHEGMKALAEIDWKKDMAFENLSEAERDEIVAEMKRASAEIRKAFKDPEVRKAMALRKESKIAARGLRNARSEKENLESEKELLLELQKAKAELESARKELEKARAELKKKSN